MNQECLKILTLIAKFQVLESVLKIYIGKSYALIKIKIAETLTFNYSYDDVENCSLERLINTLKKLNNDPELHRRLYVLKDYRNHIAHKSILIASPSLPNELKSYFLGFNENPIDYDRLNNELDECINFLVQEFQSLGGK